MVTADLRQSQVGRESSQDHGDVCQLLARLLGGHPYQRNQVRSTHPHVPSRYHQIHRPSCGKIVGLARVGRVLPSTVARAEPILAPWVSPDPDKYCIVWDQVIKLHHPVATTGGQGQPFLTDAPVHCTNAKGQPKTPEQLERATAIAISRRSAAVHIEQALAQGSYTMIVHPLS